ncbi:hypothetical protein JCM9279_006633 [Rhodotorula babjevae]
MAGTKANPPQDSTLSLQDRDKLAVVIIDLAPPLILDQPLSTPLAPGPTLRHALALDAPLPSVSTLRACISEAATSALLASALDFGNNDLDSARLLNDTDDFQRTVEALLDQLDRPQHDAPSATKRVKRDDDADADAQPASKTRRYMLHRTLATGVDLFTSSAILSDAELETLAALDDTDLVAVHPSASSSSSAPPIPSLGDASPAPPAPAFPPHVPPAARAGRAPGLHLQRLEPTSAAHPSRQPTALLSYPSPFLSSLAPTHDSTCATEPYSRTAARALGALRAQRAEERLAAGREGGLTRDERDALKEVGADVEGVVRVLRGGEAGAEQVREGEDVAARLGRNAELIAQVGRAQVVRLRRAARTRPVAAGVAGAGAGRAEGTEEAKKGSVEDEEEGLTKAGRQEKEDAAALLTSLTSLLSAHSSTRTDPSLSSASGAPPSTPSLLPPRSTLRTLTPLLLAARTTAGDAAYAGTLDEVNYRALREGQLAGSTAAAGEGMGEEHVADLKVEG